MHEFSSNVKKVNRAVAAVRTIGDRLPLKPTRITATSKKLIDIILKNRPLNLIATDVIPMGIGDHEMVGCVRKTNTAKFEPRKITCRSRNYKDYNPEGMCDDLRKVCWGGFYNLKGVNDAWGFLKKHLTNVFNKHAPMITNQQKEGISRACDPLI